MIKRILSLILALAMLVGVFPFAGTTAKAADNADGGTYDGVDWSYVDGALTFSNGKLPEATEEPFPWMQYKGQVRWVLLDADVTFDSLEALDGLGHVQRLACKNETPITLEQIINSQVEDFSADEVLYPDTWTLIKPKEGIYAYAPDRMGICGAQNEQGEYGPNLAWHLEDGTLTISGKGAMADWEFGEQAPWAVYCDEIEHVVIGDGVTTIGDRAFGIGDGVVPMSIVDSGEPFDYHFSSVTLGSDLEYIGSYAFAYCDALTEVELPSKLEAIDEAAFANCAGLEQLTIPASVKAINHSAFLNCTGVQTLEFASDATLAQLAHAFQGCTGLTKVEIPASLPGEDEIRHNGAFWDCRNLEEVTFRNGATIIDDEMFAGCTSLTTVHVPHSVSEVYENAFVGCEKLTDIYYDGYRDEWDAMLVKSGDEDVWPSDVTVHCIQDTQPPSITQVTEGGLHNQDFTVQANISDNRPGTTVTFAYSFDQGSSWQQLGQYVLEQQSKKLSQKVSIAGLEDGVIAVRITVIDAAGNEVSHTVEHVIDRIAPAAPTGLAVQTQNVTTLSLTWNLPSESDGVKSYQVYRRAEGEETFTRRASGITQNGYTDSTCESGKTYDYYVVAVDQAGNVSAQSQIVSGTTPQDITPPEVLAVTPKSDSTFGPQQTIKVHVSDDAGLDHVVVSWKAADASEWNAEQTMTLAVKGTSGSVSFTLGEQDEGTYHVRAQAYDQAGNASAYSAVVTYTLDKTAPVVSNVQAQADGSQVKIDWVSAAEADLAGFYVYRVSERGATTRVGSVGVVAGQTAYTFTDEVHWSQGGGTYTYRVLATDRYGNERMEESQPVAVTVPVDTQDPTAVLSAPTSAFAGDTLTFSAAGSSDDREIVRYAWDFGDQSTDTGKRVTHTYETGGTFTVTLQVTDAAGNTAEKTATVKVTAAEENALLNVQVYGYDVDRPQDTTPLKAQVVYDLGGENVWYDTDSDGQMELHTLDQGTVRLGAYCEGYLPGEATAELVYGQQTEVVITLKKASVVTGTLESEELTYEQIEDLGIDTQAPENQNVYKFAAQIDIGGNIEQYTYYVNDAADFVGPSIPVEPVKVNDMVYTIHPHAVRVDLPNPEGQSPKAVTIAYVTVLRVPGTVSTLKQFFEAELTVINQADAAFAMEDCRAELHIPSGLALIPTDTTAESAIVSLTAEGQQDGVIGGQQSASTKWILRGDQAGTYQLEADFDGVLQDFDVPIHADFKAEEEIEVRRQADEIQLDMYVSNVMLDRTFYVDLEVSCDTETVNLPRVSLGDYEPREIAVRQADGTEQTASGLTSLEPGQTLVYRYAIQIDEEMPLLFVSNLLEGDLQANGMTTNTYTRNITKFKLFSGDFNLTEMGVFLKTLPTLSEQDATMFWQFLFNTNRTPTSDDMYYRILTGNLEDCDQTIEELQIWILSMCQNLRARLNCYVQKSNESLGFLSQAIVDSMWKKLESNGVTGEESLKEYALKKVFNGMVQYFAGIEGISSEWVSKIQNTVIEVNTVSNAQKSAKKLVENMQLAMRTVGIILNSEYSARYAYFNYYLNQRIYHEHPGESDFQLLLAAEVLKLQDMYWTSEAIDTVTWITGKDSWTNHTDTIERWAETLYQFEVVALGYETDAQPDEPQEPDIPENPDPEDPDPEDPDDSGDQTNTGGGGASHPQAGGSASSSAASDRYEIDRPSDVAHGDIEVSSSKAQAGDTVTVTVSPEPGYGLEQLIVTDKDGEQIAVILQADGTYQFEMPVGGVEIEAVFSPVQDSDNQASFLDVSPTDWFAEAVAYIAQRGLMQGVSETAFGSEQTMSRAMIWTVLARLSGVDTDQTGGIWYQVGADWAMSNGVSDGSNPDGAMTREQLVTMLYRYAGSPAVSGELSDFADWSKVNDYAKEAMTWAVDNGLVSGMGDGTLAPQGTATRAQVAAILMRFCENIAK